MTDLYKPFLIICEGTASEVKYLQELNRYLRELSIYKIFIPKPVGTGVYTEVVKEYKKVKRHNKRSNIEIWVDNDIYKRNDQHNQDRYNKKNKAIPDFRFNYFNFEDFMIMHFDDLVLSKWENICNNTHHFDNPMHSEQYMKLIKDNLFPDYTKSSLTKDFVINKNSLKKLIEHNDTPVFRIKSDFASFLKQELFILFNECAFNG
jgi:hypothetical protein